LLGLVLLWAAPVVAQEPSELTLCFYRHGQPVSVTRTGRLSGSPQEDATSLITELLAGPTPDEQARGLTSPLPPGSVLIAVTVAGDEVTIDLRIPLDFLRHELDPSLSDAIVEQMVKTLYPLELAHVHVRTEDQEGQMVPLSHFLPPPFVPAPKMPDNGEPLPDRLGAAPETGGQPPAYGQGQPGGALTGTTAWLSAGHGWYWDGDGWATQRPEYNGLVEDLSNAEAVNWYLARYLWNAGADVWLVRERAMNEHEVIVDNDDGAPAYTETGTWTTSSSPGYENGSYRWSSTFQNLTATATWTPDLPEAGWYAVWAWYLHGANRPTDARYEIHHAGGVTTVSISQEVHGQTWRYLGEYYFQAGTAGRVTLLNQSDDYDPSQAVIADAIRFGGGLGSIEEGEPGGTSGQPRWEEAAKYWARTQGAPEQVYAYDATSRPRYAEWETAKGYPGEVENAVYVSWHTNGFDGTLSGTESYIHVTEPTPGSAALQDWLHSELIADLRAAWDPGWVNRGQKSADYGELRELSTIPGVLLEIAFHDSPSDADALREPIFRQIAARAVYQGIVKYHAERQGAPVHLLPEPPERLVARNTAPGEVTLTWAAPRCCDGMAGDAATEYKVYHSTRGRAFDNGVETDDLSLAVTGLSPGSLHFFRVTALNEGGESFPTPVVAVRTPANGEPVALLVVDGFDRLDQTALIPQSEAAFGGTARRMYLERMNRYDYAVEHGQALDACALAFDGAMNEAVEAGDLVLGRYAAVDWFVGEDSGADTAVDSAALSDVERALLASYLDGGGGLLISGSEIGYDLVEQGRDPSFYHDYLRASYQGDDAGTYQFAGLSGSLFEGLAGRFDDSTGGTYDVAYPDRLGGTAGSTVVLEYAGGSGGGAGVVHAGDGRVDDGRATGSRIVHIGFPLETVTDPATRAALICRAAEFVLPEEVPLAVTPRLINPGFEQGQGQSSWQTETSDDYPIFAHRQSLPTTVEPHGGDWLAWLGSYTPGVSVTTALTQVVALPSGEPTATLSLASLVHVEGSPPPNGDRLSASIHDLNGTFLTELLTLTNQAPVGIWQTAEFNMGAFSGETVQLVFRTTSTETAFFLDDVSLTTAGPPGPDEFRALWVDAYHDGIKSQGQIDELIETAQAGSFNAVVVQVRRRGDTYYPSAIDPWAPDSTPDSDALAYLIQRAHAAGIEVHAWATTLAIWGGNTLPSDPEHTFITHGCREGGASPDCRESREYWLMISDSGDEPAANVYYLDPGHPDAVDYTVAVYAELAANYDLDGLHLDRVRYPAQTWGYNPTSLSRFRAQMGRDDIPVPTDPEWLQWRRDQVTALVRKIYLTVAAIKPRLRLSGALSTSGGAPYTEAAWYASTPFAHHLQDWRSWLEEGILDLGIPMTYKRESVPEQKSDFDGWIEWEKDHQYERGVSIGTALYLNSVPDSMSQWARARQPSPAGNRALGLSGYSYATPSNDGTPRRTFVNAAVTGHFTRTASIPALPWKDTPALGHLAGRLTQSTECRTLDGYPLNLTGPQDRTLLTDGSGWFGAVDLPPGAYLLSVNVVSPTTTLQVPVTIAAGAVSEQEISLPACTTERVVLPLILRQAGP
jgi:uncharacterized lipoprotein YddW (UPF0748 family)